AADDDLHAVLQVVFQAHVDAAEDRRLELRLLVAERQIPVAGRVLLQVRDLARYPHVRRKGFLQKSLDAARQLADGVDLHVLGRKWGSHSPVPPTASSTIGSPC